MVTYTEGDGTVNGSRLHYYRTGGDKPPLVLLHGITDDGLCWASLAEPLAADYDVIMPDAYGHGKSGAVEGEFSFERVAELTAGLLSELGIEQAVIIGHSMGASVAAVVAAENPDLARAVVLEDPPWAPPTPGVGPSEGMKFIQGLFQWLTENRPTIDYETLLKMTRETNPTWSDEDMEPCVRAKLTFDLKVLGRQGALPDFHDLVPKLRMPVLMLTAESGILTAETAAEAEALAVAPFRHVRVAGAGHNIRRDQPAAYMKALSEFLQTVN